jgi:hypothetical protein
VQDESCFPGEGWKVRQETSKSAIHQDVTLTCPLNHLLLASAGELACKLPRKVLRTLAYACSRWTRRRTAQASVAAVPTEDSQRFGRSCSFRVVACQQAALHPNRHVETIRAAILFSDSSPFGRFPLAYENAGLQLSRLRRRAVRRASSGLQTETGRCRFGALALRLAWTVSRACSPNQYSHYRGFRDDRKFPSAFSLLWLEDLVLFKRSIPGEYSPLSDLLPMIVPALVPELSVIVVAIP